MMSYRSSDVKIRLREIFLLVLFTLCKTSTDNLEVGKSLNFFGRYAYYSISMKVVKGRNDTKPWVFREPLCDVFQNLSCPVSCLPPPKNLIHGEFHLEFCDNLHQLLQAYFRDFLIEGMDESWRAFTSSWNENTMAKNFGIDVEYVVTQRSYILVRASRRRKCKTLSNPLEGSGAQPLPHVKALADQVTFGNKESVLTFIRTYGSHYISAYSTGNSLYQVFVFHTPVYRIIKARMQTKGINALSKNELITIFSPWVAEQVGSILSASGNMTVINWANKYLQSTSHLYPYASLMKLYGEAECFKKLDGLLGNEALLSLELKTLSNIFKNPKIRIWFLEFLFNNMQLWENNMYSFIGR